MRKSIEPTPVPAFTLRLIMTVGRNHRDWKRVTRMEEQVRTALARQNLNGTVVKEMEAERALVRRIVGH